MSNNSFPPKTIYVISTPCASSSSASSNHQDPEEPAAPELGNSVNLSKKNEGKKSKKKKKKLQVLMTRDGTPVKRPKRALSAYNIFFQHQRKIILDSLPGKAQKPRKSHGKIDFKQLAQTIAERWKKITAQEKQFYELLSLKDQERNLREKDVWEKLKLEQNQQANPSQNQNYGPVPAFSAAEEDFGGTSGCFVSQSEPVLAFEPESPPAEPKTRVFDEFAPLPLDDVAIMRPMQSILTLPHTSLRYSTERQEMARLAQILGPDCVKAFVKAFLPK